jgi:hypothetical protein
MASSAPKKKRINKKKVLSVFIVFSSFLYWGFSGCTGPRYSAGFNLETHLVEYDSLQGNITHEHDSMSTSFANATNNTARERKIEEARKYLQGTLTNEVFPYWYKTEWDFNGITQQPRSGAIACGYFVTTTLKHAGFDLERSRLAQQPASYIIKTLCDRSTLKRIGHNDTNRLISHMNAQPDGVYIIGLDSHVGFVLKQYGELYFIHSSYSNGRQVLKEKLAESGAIIRSENYHIANLFANDKIISKWLKKQSIATITS